MSIDLEGTIKSIKFQPKGEERDVVATITIECQPNELEAGTLSRFAGKDIEFSILSRQIELPLKQERDLAHAVSE
jgi:hypothetical protein